MTNLKSQANRLLVGLVIAVQILFFPAVVLGETTEPTATDPAASTTQASEPAAETTASPTPPPPSPSTSPVTSTSQSTGPTQPTGAASSSYEYNPDTGLWENDKYTWDPVTKQTKPKQPQTYSYNPDTGMWDTTEWVFDAPSGKYVANTKSAASPPAGALIANTGPDSVNTVDNNSTTNGTFDLFYDARISNSLDSMALSGDASVLSNTNGGSATSGKALTISNIINVLQSTWGIQPTANADLVTFSADINGNVVGDLYLDPSRINTTGPDSISSINNNNENNLTINVEGSGLINNDIDMLSQSGDATVSNNTNGGNATTGSADAIANVVNVINSAIAAGKSFLGVLNINGNLNGDILLPPNFLDQLIASSAPRATVNLTNTNETDLSATLRSNQTISNTVDLAAASGNADVTHNTNAGNATSGDAQTNLTIFNLTNRQVIGKNSLMVFVNVLGKWVGLIVDAPAGSSAAAFCGGTCTINNTNQNDININENTNNTINNNLNLGAFSGDATVSNNTNAGNATSGDASASANILNINESIFNFSDWFGMLFINVLGTWNGSFGIDTDAGTLKKLAQEAAKDPGGTKVKVFQFIPAQSTNGDISNSSTGGSTQSATSASSDQKMAGAFASTNNNQSPKADAGSGGVGLWLPIATALLAMLLFGLGSLAEYSDRLWGHFMNFKLNRKLNLKQALRQFFF